MDYLPQNSNNDKITVIIPTYNRAVLLKRAINSILNQIRLPNEILIIDDCSSDNTPALLDSFSDNSLISWIRLSKNIGAYKCRNLGLLLSKGQYITFHDSDDFCDIRKLDAQYNSIKKPINGATENPYIAFNQELMPRGITDFPDVAACANKRIELNGEENLSSTNMLNLVSYFFPNLVLCSKTPYFHLINSLIRRQIFCELGGFLPYLVGGDDEYRNRIVAYGGVFTFNPIPLYTFHKTPGSLTTARQTGHQSDYRKKIRKEIAARSSKMLQFRDRENFLNQFSVKIDIPEVVIDNYANLKDLKIAEDIPCTEETKNQIIKQLAFLQQIKINAQ